MVEAWARPHKDKRTFTAEKQGKACSCLPCSHAWPRAMQVALHGKQQSCEHSMTLRQGYRNEVPTARRLA